MTGRLKRVGRAALVGVAVLVALACVVYAVGLALPSDHVASMSIDLAAKPARVWPLVEDVAGAARWRPEVESVDAERSAEGRVVRFVERSSWGATPFAVVEVEPPTRQVVRVVDEGLPFGGTWTYEVEPLGSGTRVTITEEGFVRSPVFRVMGRLFFPPTATMEAWLRALAAELGDGAEARVLRAR